jgi:hypothetical protein
LPQNHVRTADIDGVMEYDEGGGQQDFYCITTP